METTTVIDYRPAIIKWGIALILLNIADVYTTHALFARGGIELNPVAKLFIYSFALALFIKTAFPAFVIWRSQMKPTKFIRNSVIGVTLLYAAVLCNNTYHLVF